MQKTDIEWADVVWNPLTGCTKVSAGCKNCYVETMTKRFESKWGKFNEIKFHPERLDQPKKLKKPSRIFVNSMSDLFHESLDFWDLIEIFRQIKFNPQHIFIVLTKRPQKALEFINFTNEMLKKQDLDEIFPMPNLWLGVSCENQETADERIPILLQIPAAIRFVSLEPLLGEIDLTFEDEETGIHYNCLTGEFEGNDSFGNKLDWVIVGGESGPKAREINPIWVDSIVMQCFYANIPFFFKQWGTWFEKNIDTLDIPKYCFTINEHSEEIPIDQKTYWDVFKQLRRFPEVKYGSL